MQSVGLTHTLHFAVFVGYFAKLCTVHNFKILI